MLMLCERGEGGKREGTEGMQGEGKEGMQGEAVSLLGGRRLVRLSLARGGGAEAQPQRPADQVCSGYAMREWDIRIPEKQTPRKGSLTTVSSEEVACRSGVSVGAVVMYVQVCADVAVDGGGGSGVAGGRGSGAHA